MACLCACVCLVVTIIDVIDSLCAHVQVYLAAEAYTSKRCHGCKSGDCTPFRVAWNPRAGGLGEWRKVWGLVRCDRCARLFQRDINSALNILTVVWAALRGQGHPSYLTAEAAPPTTQHGGDSSSSHGVGVRVRGAML